MNRKLAIAAAAVLAACSVHGQTTYEVKGSFPLQLAIWYPVQALPGNYEVTGLKLNLPYGYNEHVVGIDAGVYGTARVMEAVQVNVMNDVIEQLTGWQVGVINRSGALAGLQTGVLNFVDLEASGLQIGLINRADDIVGVQIGIINTCEMMQGIQIGLVNIIAESSVPFMIGINCRF